MLQRMALEDYETKERHMGAEMTRNLERLVTLKVVDEKWMDHLDAMDQMRQGIGLRAIGQRDPLVEYKHEAYDMFGSMIADIQEEIVRIMYFAQLVERPKERRNLVESRPGVTALGSAAAGAKGAPGEIAGPKQQPAVSNKVGRNDLCP
jgi:preprotein translocase subunit SecA